MSLIRQIAVVVTMNLRNLPQRFGASLVTVIGIAGVVAVLVSVLAMATGFQRTVAGTGSRDRAIILANGALNEGQSAIPRDAVASILAAPGIAKDATGRAKAEGEVLAQLQVPQRRGGNPINIPLRGVGLGGIALRPEIHLTEGRMFRPGLFELVVGQNAASRFGTLTVGSHVQFQNGDWVVVGIYRTETPSAIESEVLTDAQTLLSVYQRNWYQSILVGLDGPGSLEQLKQVLAADQRLHVDVHLESEYAATQSLTLSAVLRVLGYFIGSMMAIGALFGALNTLYAAVSARSREIATLRALGFGAAPVVASVLVESLLLAGTGALIGAAIAWAVFDGHVTSMTAGGLQSQVAFAMNVPPTLIAVGMVWACLIGIVGGAFPALRAARLPIARALNAEI